MLTEQQLHIQKGEHKSEWEWLSRLRTWETVSVCWSLKLLSSHGSADNESIINASMVAKNFIMNANVVKL